MNRTHHWLSYVLMFGLTWFLIYTIFNWQIVSLGLTWDEPAYMRAALAYREWLDRIWQGDWVALQPAVLSAYWEYNHEHPPLVKVWYAFVAVPLIPQLGEIVAFRMAAVALSALLIAVVATSVMAQWGVPAGLVSVALLLSMPRLFFHAHVAALDIPGALAYILPVLLFWHMRNRRSWWIGVLFGIIWGLALATKVNAAFALPVLGIWWLCCSRQLHLFGRLALMTMIAPLVFVAVWPWLWVDTSERMLAYLRWLTVDHWQIPQWFLGERLLPPPWYFGVVIVLMVTPLALLILGTLGIRWRSHDERSYVTLMVIAAVMPIVALMSSSVVYDNDRLAMPFFVAWAILATHGVMQVATWLSRGDPRRQRFMWLVVLALSVTPAVVQVRMLWPHLLSYYSESIGGLQGAAQLQMDHTYWNESYQSALYYLDEHAPPRARVWVEPWSLDVPHTYQRAQMTRSDLQFGSDTGGSIWGMRVGQFSPIDADYVVVTYRFAGWTPVIQALVAGNNQPVYTITRQGVTLLEVYRIP
ncbi:MAG: ArnT family glycosyltransferase [Roseiflexaceae bacterium]